MYKKKSQWMELLLCFLDGIAVVCSMLLAGILRYEKISRMFSMETPEGLFSIVLIAHVAVFYTTHTYGNFYERGRYHEIMVSIKHNVLLIATAMIIGFCLKINVFTSRLVCGYFGIINTLLTCVVHILVRNMEVWFHFGKRNASNLLVVTTAEKLPEAVERFGRSKEQQWNIAGVLLLGDQTMPEALRHLPQIPAEGDAYVEYATSHVVDEVFIQADSIQKRESFLKEMILTFEKMGVAVNLSLDLFDMGEAGVKEIDKLEEYSVITFASRLFDYRVVQLKRLVDIVGALVGLVITFVVGIFLAPVLLLESPGPLIFKQKRVGVNGRIFNFYKFRSMYADAEARKKELMAQNEMSGLMFKIENDPRITKVGAFIRKTSIDELPQFWNVLKGDMSLVGTRPPTVDEYKQYSFYQKRRISFRPGITGLWQISGRSDIKDFDEVVKLDLEYIDNWSLLLDFKILLKTVAVVFLGKGAS